ncbi:hypothetical protein G7075_03035 [Phycicoccus sp. HDW14]|uniref:hypothetical protein n=1 Tax=Phycicoccus sp. HDW14 TaxID=2714941 RepID=UPI0014087EAD|nr:hypothetical protein [Phycicoccus sp. HDW14]QIM20356.1 hypothetical protein G7075_03035 [Phycicoccus sp. HDW14]
MVWGVRLVLVLVGLGVLGIVVLVLGVIVRPVVTEALRANAAGDWWLPFLPRTDGRYGPLAENHWWSAMRAETPGSTGGLAVRWGFWTLMSLLLVFAAGSILVNLVKLLAKGWASVG